MPDTSVGHEMPGWTLLATPPDPVTLTVSGCCGAVKVAVTFAAALSTSTHVGFEPAKEHAPPQLANEAPAIVEAVSVTAVPAAKLVEQSGWARPQAMPVGVLVTTPFCAPDPLRVTSSGTFDPSCWNCAVTVTSLFIWT